MVCITVVLVVYAYLRDQSGVRRIFKYISSFCRRGLPRERVKEPHLPETMASAHTAENNLQLNSAGLEVLYIYWKSEVLSTGQVLNRGT